MRVISCVPSWTETLLEAGIPLVGRTRYCIHPREKLSSIPIVGGTKNIDFEKVKSLKPDILILDKEENPKDFFDHSPCECLVTHVTDLKTMTEGFALLAQKFASVELMKMQKLAQELCNAPDREWNWNQIPFSLETGPNRSFKNIVYLIWANPFMTISSQTYIGAVLQKLGARPLLINFDKKYPEIVLQDLDPQETLLLLSTEPFPFAKKREVIPAGFASVLVDGEQYSWYGVRGLKALAQQMNYLSV